jgi:hypothetical protein
MADARGPELVRQEIALERAQLAGAVGRLRAEMMSARRRLGARLKVFAATFAAVVLLLATLRAAFRYVLSRIRR